MVLRQLHNSKYMEVRQVNERKKYNIGLDIGTSSVGWAVVESGTQKIIKKGKNESRKSLWGVRLFEPANTALERRSFRSARRRYNKFKHAQSACLNSWAFPRCLQRKAECSMINTK